MKFLFLHSGSIAPPTVLSPPATGLGILPVGVGRAAACC